MLATNTKTTGWWHSTDECLAYCPTCNAPVDEHDSFDGVQETGGRDGYVKIGAKCVKCEAKWTEVYRHHASVVTDLSEAKDLLAGSDA
jgi:hypothetical protein